MVGAAMPGSQSHLMKHGPDVKQFQFTVKTTMFVLDE
jgi:hypothetical protein